MYGTYLRLDITVHDGWRLSFAQRPAAYATGAARSQACAARKRFYRQMLDYHCQSQEIVMTWRL